MTATIAHEPTIAPGAVMPPTGQPGPEWVPLGPGMLERWVVLKRDLSAAATGPHGYWAGPADPGRYWDCLAFPNFRTRGRTDYAPVAAFADPGTAWWIWNHAHIPGLGHGWALEINRLGDINDWTCLPPVQPRFDRPLDGPSC